MPKLLDLFCGAGGAAMGYHLAGFEVIGIDNQPQKNYPFEFHQMDWQDGLERFAARVDIIHASPPCQAYSRATAWVGSRENHPDLISEVRVALTKSNIPFVIENVQEARRLLRFPVMLCGSMFGLRIQRHRYFEAPSLPLILVRPCQHRRDDFSHDHGKKQAESVYRDEMGCGWMTVQEARQAIPPAYTRFLGGHLITSLERNHAETA